MSEKPCLEDPWTDNMANGLKHCCNLNDSMFTIFINHCGGNYVGKTLFKWYKKSYDFLLTHWLLMTSILCFIETILRNRFRCNYLKKKNLFLHFFFFCIFKTYLKFWTFPQKKMTLIADAFPEIPVPKNMVR